MSLITVHQVTVVQQLLPACQYRDWGHGDSGGCGSCKHMDNSTDAPENTCHPLPKFCDVVDHKLYSCDVQDFPDLAECPKVSARPSQEDCSRLQSQDTDACAQLARTFAANSGATAVGNTSPAAEQAVSAVNTAGYAPTHQFLQLKGFPIALDLRGRQQPKQFLPENELAADFAAIPVSADEHLLARTPPSGGLSPLLQQVAAEAAKQYSGAGSSISRLPLQASPQKQLSASSTSATGSAGGACRSSPARTSSWQPERTQFGFSVHQEVPEPHISLSLVEPELPSMVDILAAMQQQQQVQQQEEPLGNAHTAHAAASQQAAQKQAQQQRQQYKVHSDVAAPRQQRPNSIGSEGSITVKTPKANTKGSSSSIGVSPGLQARIQAAELAAAGRFDPISWAAAEAEAIQADKEAAAAAARQAQLQHLQEELQKRRAEAARVAVQLTEAKGHFSVGEIAAAAHLQHHLHQQQQQQVQAALTPLLQHHKKSLPGRLVMTDYSGLCNSAAGPSAVQVQTSLGGADHPNITATEGASEANPSPAAAATAAVAGGSPGSPPSLPGPELLLQDISLVVTSSLFEGSRGSSPQPRPLVGAPVLDHSSIGQSAGVEHQQQPVCVGFRGQAAAAAGQEDEDRDSNIAVAVSRLLQPTASQEQASSSSSMRASGPVSGRSSDPDVAASEEPVQPSSSTVQITGFAAQDINSSSSGAGSVAAAKPAAGFRADGKRPSALAVPGQVHRHEGQQQQPQQQPVSPGKRGATAASSSSRSAARGSKGSAARSPTASPSGLSPQQSPRSPAYWTSGVSAQQPPKSPASGGLSASGTSSVLTHRSLRLPTSRVTPAGSSTVSPRESPRSPSSGTAGVSPRGPASGTPGASPRTRHVAAVRPPWNSTTRVQVNLGSNDSTSGSDDSSTFTRNGSGTRRVRSALASPPVSPSGTSAVRTGVAAPSRIPRLASSSGLVTAAAASNSKDQQQQQQQQHDDDEAAVMPRMQHMMRQHSSLRPATPPMPPLVLQKSHSLGQSRLAAPAALAPSASDVSQRYTVMHFASSTNIRAGSAEASSSQVEAVRLPGADAGPSAEAPWGRGRSSSPGSPAQASRGSDFMPGGADRVHGFSFGLAATSFGLAATRESIDRRVPDFKDASADTAGGHDDEEFCDSNYESEPASPEAQVAQLWPQSHKLVTSSYGIDSTTSCLITHSEAIDGDDSNVCSNGRRAAHTGTSEHDSAAPERAGEQLTGTSHQAAVVVPEDTSAMLRHHYLRLSSDDDCIMMPPELVVGRLSPRSSGTGCLAAAALSRGSSNASSPAASAAHSRSSSTAGALPYSCNSSIGGSMLGDASRQAAASAAAEVAAESALVQQLDDSTETEAAEYAAADAATDAAGMLGVYAAVADSADGFVEKQQAMQHEKPHESAGPSSVQQGVTASDSNGAGCCSTAEAASLHGTSSDAISLPASTSSSIAAAAACPPGSSSGTLDQSLNSSDAAATAPCFDSTSSGSEQQPQALQQNGGNDDDAPQQQQQQQQQQKLSSVEATPPEVAEVAVAAADVVEVTGDLSAGSSADLLLSPLPFGAVPRKLMSRQSSTQSFTSDHDQPEEAAAMPDQHTNSPSHFMMSLSMSMSCSPQKSETLESTLAATAAAAAAVSGRRSSAGGSSKPPVAAAAAAEQQVVAAVDGMHELLQQVTAAGGAKQQERSVAEQADAPQQQQRQRQRNCKDSSDGLSGHQRLQQLIPQRPRPRQQQMPARILTWAGSGSPTAQSAVAASATTVAAAGDAGPEITAVNIGRSSSGASAAAAGAGAELSHQPPPSSLPMAILRPASGQYDGSSSSSSNHRSNSGGSDIELAESGGRHRGAHALAALITRDNRITNSFKSALLDSICDADDRGVAQQQQEERGGRGRCNSYNNLALRQQQQEEEQQQQQQQPISNVVAFSFPRTSSTPAFGGRGKMAPSLSGGAAAAGTSPCQQQQQQGAQAVAGSYSYYLRSTGAAAAAGSTTGAAAASGAGTSYNRTWSGGNRNNSSSSVNGSGMPAGSVILAAAPILKISRSSGNLQVVSSSLPGHSQGLAVAPGRNRGFAGAGYAGFSPISEGTTLTAASSSMGSGYLIAADQQQQQQQLSRAGSSPVELAPGQELLSRTWSQGQDGVLGAAAVTAAAGGNVAYTAVSSMVAGVESVTVQQQQQGGAAGVNGAGSKRQQGLLSAQMRQRSSSNNSRYVATATTSVLVLPDSPTGDQPAVAGTEQAIAVVESRVRGSKSAVAALLGLTSVAAAVPDSCGDCALSLPQKQQQQQQTPPGRRSRVSWADDECTPSSSGSGHLAAAAAACAFVPSSSSPVGAKSLSVLTTVGLTGTQGGGDPCTGPTSPTTTLFSPTAAAASNGTPAAAAAQPTTPVGAGLPPAGPSRSSRKKAGLMRPSKSCMEFSSLIAAAAAAADQPAAATAAGDMGDMLAASISMDGIGTAVGSSNGWLLKQQQQPVNVFTGAFAAKGSVAPTPPAAGAAEQLFSSNRASATATPAAIITPGAAETFSRQPSGGAEQASSQPVAMPTGGAPGHGLSGARSAPADISLLSCSWHEIEPLLDDDIERHQALRRNGLKSKPGVYSYEGDFYGAGRARGSSFTAGCSPLQQPPQQQQQVVMTVQQQDQQGRQPQPDQLQQQQSVAAMRRDAAQQLAAAAAAASRRDAPRQERQQQQQQQHHSSSGSWFGFSWFRRKPASSPRGLPAAPSPEAVAAAAAAQPASALDLFDLSGLMLMGQWGINDSGQALRRVVHGLELQTGGAIPYIPY